MLLTFIIPYFVAAFGLLSFAKPLEERQSSGKPFNLYAYGEGIPGLQVFYADGQAQIGDMSLSNASNKVPMYVTYSDNDRLTWVAHANTTQSSRLAFKATGTTSTSTSINLLCLKQGNSMINPVIFTGINTSNNTTAEGGTITDTWSLYGSNVLLTQPNGNFYAKSTGENGWWQLVWSTSQSAGLEAIPLALRTNPPVLT